MNDPLLFIDSTKDKKTECNSNQEYFDSRTSTKKNNNAIYRLEDIKAMLYYRINVLTEIYTINAKYEGFVTEVTEDGLKLKHDDVIDTIALHDIKSINILKL